VSGETLILYFPGEMFAVVWGWTFKSQLRSHQGRSTFPVVWAPYRRQALPSMPHSDQVGDERVKQRGRSQTGFKCEDMSAESMLQGAHFHLNSITPSIITINIQ
jgi:hypothetical protein